MCSTHIVRFVSPTDVDNASCCGTYSRDLKNAALIIDLRVTTPIRLDSRLNKKLELVHFADTIKERV